MAALCKSILKSSLGSKYLGFAPCITSQKLQKRYKRWEPEEEIENLFITESFEDKLAKLRGKPVVPTDIGRKLPASEIISAGKRETRAVRMQKMKNKLPRDAVMRDTNVRVPLDALDVDYARSPEGAHHAVSILQHYNMFTDLFKDSVFFHPDASVGLKLGFETDDPDMVYPVFRGNKLLPSDTASTPLVGFTPADGYIYSLLMVNLDGHLTQENGEYLHWYSGEDPEF